MNASITPKTTPRPASADGTALPKALRKDRDSGNGRSDLFGLLMKAAANSDVKVKTNQPLGAESSSEQRGEGLALIPDGSEAALHEQTPPELIGNLEVLLAAPRDGIADGTKPAAASTDPTRPGQAHAGPLAAVSKALLDGETMPATAWKDEGSEASRMMAELPDEAFREAGRTVSARLDAAGSADTPEMTAPEDPVAALATGDGPAIKVSVVHQETHLPPVMRNLVMPQIVEPLRGALGGLDRSAATSAAELEGGADIKAPTKVLHIELSPVELGHVTVKLRLTMDRMEMRLEASQAATAALLARDEATLREVIKASGYQPDAIIVETASVDRPTERLTAADPAAGSGGTARDETTSGHPFARDQRRDQAPDRQPGTAWAATEDHQPSQEDRPHDASSHASGGGRALYL